MAKKPAKKPAKNSAGKSGKKSAGRTAASRKRRRPAGPRGPARGKGRSPQGSSWSPGLVGVVVVALVAVVGLLYWATRPAESGGGGDARIEHVHGLGVNPGDGNGKLYVAAHNGVFRVSGGKAKRVGGEQDTMGFTVVGPDHFLGSGHPGPDDGGPANLGLIESVDGGATWKTVSLKGEADFHALRYRHETVYGYHAGQLMVSGDKQSWETRSQVGLRDFAVSPADADTLVASGENGLMRSSDGGRKWSTGGAAVMLLAWPAEKQLWAIGGAGEVMRSADQGKSWSETGTVDGQVTAFAVHQDTLYVAVGEGEIRKSTDNGKNWKTIYS